VTVTTGPQAGALEELAQDIRRHHKEVEAHASAMVAAAIAAGEKLIEAKEQLPHGEFGPFLTYCGVSPRSARVYMQLARKSADAAVLDAKSIRAALEAIAKPKPKPKQLDFGPPCPPSLARDKRWQAEQWLKAMAAQGRRDIPEVARHFRSDGKARKGISAYRAEAWSEAWSDSFYCDFCGEWHAEGKWLPRDERKQQADDLETDAPVEAQDEEPR
jgi:hypothetical protein